MCRSWLNLSETHNRRSRLGSIKRFNLQRLFDQADFRMRHQVSNAVRRCGRHRFRRGHRCRAPDLPAPVASIVIMIVRMPILWCARTSVLPPSTSNCRRPSSCSGRFVVGRSLVRSRVWIGRGRDARAHQARVRRCFEEQNFGISLEESLNAMTERNSQYDLKFLARPSSCSVKPG